VSSSLNPSDAIVFARHRLLPYCISQWDGYEPAHHHRLIASKLEAVERGEIKRLMIFMPPRHGKSQLTSEFFPAWYLGRNPDKYIITSTYSQELAEDFGRKVRNQLQDDVFKATFPDCILSDDSQSAKRFGTTKRGTYFAVGVGSSITGRGAHLLLIDDPIKNREEADSDTVRRKLKDWYTSTAYTRLMPGGAIIVIQTRWHDDDLAGWLLAEHSHEDWDVIDLPAVDEHNNPLWPEKYPLIELNKIKRTIGDRDWTALYQQKPVTEGGNILKPAWFRRWPDDIKMPLCDHVFFSWDTAYTTEDHKSNSYSAYTKWGIFWNEADQRHAILLLGRWADRIDYPDLRAKAIEVTKKDNPHCHLIEKKASGQSLVQDLNRARIRVRTYMPDRDKISRAYAVQAMLQSGQVFVPNKPWVDDLLTQLAKFPSGAPPSSDLTDTVTQALLYLRNGLWVEHPDDKDQVVEHPMTEEQEDDLQPQRRSYYG
jgi:predicted phage terminase large subunit-like protein